MKIYHGSQSVIKVPQYGLAKVGNDFGLGFYCTESEDLAKEWSVQPNRDGFANAYELDIDGLNILRLNNRSPWRFVSASLENKWSSSRRRRSAV